eukprot:TRINITY_DN4925_c0_g1_i2.p1 TRINITY_DN4925_c0_g1~~TRINITY_DN4925_c0_g1_i2.p1  ORF type:complete len:365 (+),score=38.29 TRINITY_DN4925_c0_g1_i2:65-1159(+)
MVKEGISMAGMPAANSKGAKHAITALIYIIMWYAFSIGLTFYNQWLFEVYGLEFPLMITSCHGLCTAMLAFAARNLVTRGPNETVPSVSYHDWFFRISPAGITSAMDVGLSNLSLEYINITLYTIVKSTVVVWTLISAFIFRLEKPTRPLIVVIVTICLGLILFRAKEGITFHSIGFFLILSASMMSGLRWVLTQLVMQREKERLGPKHPIDTMAYVAPCMGLSLLPFAFYFEGRGFFSSDMLFGRASVALTSLFWIMFGACLAFFLTLSEFLLVRHTSGLTFSIAGIVKEILTISIAVLFVPGNSLTLLNMLGLGVSIVGIAYYNKIKLSDTPSPAEHDKVEMQPLKLADEYSSDDDHYDTHV